MNRLRPWILLAMAPVLLLSSGGLLITAFGRENAVRAAAAVLAFADRALGLLFFMPPFLSWALLGFLLGAGCHFILWEARRLSAAQRSLVGGAALAGLLVLFLVVPVLSADRGRTEARGAWWRPDSYRQAGAERTFNGVPFVWVPAGSVVTGSPVSEPGRTVDEVRRVAEFRRGFWMSRGEITREQYARLVPEADYPAETAGAGLPVTGVSWDEAAAFAAAFSNGSGGRFRLPTEMEWEYACRAGADTAYYFGADPEQLPDFAWFNENSSGGPQPVEKKKPNAWGLHDMHGNVAEWCVSRRNGEEARVYRGGSWRCPPAECRAAARGLHIPGQTTPPADTGIRLLREP